MNNIIELTDKTANKYRLDEINKIILTVKLKKEKI